MDDGADILFFKNFVRTHWKAVLLLVLGGIGVFIGSICVLLWFIGYSEIGGHGSLLLGNWSMETIINFLLNLILWEFLIIGIPIIAVGVVIFFQWWKKLPDEEKEGLEKHGYKKRKNQRRVAFGGGGGLIGILVFIAFCIIINLDGNWTTVLGSLEYSYLVYTWLIALMWVLIICGIPLVLIIFFWLRMEIREDIK
jgi:hypothetical protein